MKGSSAAGGSNEAEAARSRRLLLASAAMLLLAAGMAGGLFYLRERAQGPRFQKGERFQLVPPALAARQREQRMAKAEWLRDKWRPWAQKNKEVLRKLAQARPGDEAVMLATLNALPTMPTAKATGFSIVDLADGVQATWQPFLKDSLNSPTSPNDHQVIMRRFRQEFASEHDMVLSTMSHPDSPTTFVWASGRVTEQEAGAAKVKKKPGTSELEIMRHPHRELFPAYEFLR